MSKMPIVSLPDTARELGESGKRVNVLWQNRLLVEAFGPKAQVDDGVQRWLLA